MVSGVPKEQNMLSWWNKKYFIHLSLFFLLSQCFFPITTLAYTLLLPSIFTSGVFTVSPQIPDLWLVFLFLEWMTCFLASNIYFSLNLWWLTYDVTSPVLREQYSKAQLSVNIRTQRVLYYVHNQESRSSRPLLVFTQIRSILLLQFAWLKFISASSLS